MLAERACKVADPLADVGPRQFALAFENGNTLRIDLKGSP